MGQYHLVANLSRKEFIDPHKLGVGLKLVEQLHSRASTPHAIFILLAASNGTGGRGGGDLRGAGPDVIGRWAGDQIAIIGDYAEESDLPKHNAKKIYEQISNSKEETPLDRLARADEEDPPRGFKAKASDPWRDITYLIRDYMAEEFGFKITKDDGWVDRKFHDEGYDGPPGG